MSSIEVVQNDSIVESYRVTVNKVNFLIHPTDNEDYSGNWEVGTLTGTEPVVGTFDTIIHAYAAIVLYCFHHDIATMDEMILLLVEDGL